jgi:hypothetical protein
MHGNPNIDRFGRSHFEQVHASTRSGLVRPLSLDLPLDLAEKRITQAEQLEDLDDLEKWRCKIRLHGMFYQHRHRSFHGVANELGGVTAKKCRCSDRRRQLERHRTNDSRQLSQQHCEQKEHDREQDIECQVKDEKGDDSRLRQVDIEAAYIDADPAQRYQYAEHDYRYPDQVYKYVERMLMRRCVTGQHRHEFSFFAHLQSQIPDIVDYTHMLTR